MISGTGMSSWSCDQAVIERGAAVRAHVVPRQLYTFGAERSSNHALASYSTLVRLTPLHLGQQADGALKCLTGFRWGASLEYLGDVTLEHLTRHAIHAGE